MQRDTPGLVLIDCQSEESLNQVQKVQIENHSQQAGGLRC